MSKTIRRLLFSTVAILIVVLAASTVAFAGGSSTPTPAPPQEDHSNDQAYIAGTWYKYMYDAVAACKEGETIEVKKDFNDAIDITKSITINLNGHTWGASVVKEKNYCFTVSNGAKVTINGNGNGSKLWGKQGYLKDGKYYGGIGVVKDSTLTLKGSIQLYSNSSDTGKYADYGALFALQNSTLYITDTVNSHDHSWTGGFKSNYAFYLDRSTLSMDGTGYFDKLYTEKALIYLSGNSYFTGTSPSGNQSSNARRMTACGNAILCEGSNNHVTLKGTFAIGDTTNPIVVNGSANYIDVQGSVYIGNTKSTTGIYITGDNNKVTLSGGKLTSCYPGLYVKGSANNVSVTGSMQIINSTYAISFDGGSSSSNTLNIDGDTEFNNNVGDYGGALYLTGNVNATIGGKAKFSGNKANQYGGAIYAMNKANVYIGNNGNPTFSSNSANKGGGAVCVDGGTLKIDSNTKFSDNRSIQGHHIYTDHVSTLTINEGYKTSTNGKVTSYGCPTFTNSKNINGAIILAYNCTKFDSNIKDSTKEIVFENTGGSNGLQALVFDDKTTTVNLSNMRFKGFDGCASVISVPGKATINLAAGIFENCNCTDAPIVIASGATLNQSDIAVTGSKTGETVTTKFESCKGSNAGVINCSGTLNIQGKPVFKNCSSTNGAGLINTNGDVYIFGGEINNCDGDKSVFYVGDKAAKIDISNMTITNCDSKCDGAVIYAPKGTVSLSNVTISKCKTSKNDAKGGVIYAQDVNLILKTKISDSSAQYGGAVYATNTLKMSGDAIIINCTASKDGGGVYAKNANLTASASIANCKADGNGGGIYVDSGSLDMTVAAYLNNCTASNDGGGIYIAKGSGKINGSESNGRVAYIAMCSAGKNGGCIYAKDSSLEISGKAYTNGKKGDAAQYLAQKGGSVYLAGISRLILKGYADLRYTAAQQGGGVYVESDASLEITDYAKVSLCVAQTQNGINDGEGGGVYNLGKVKITATNGVDKNGKDITGGLKGCAAKIGGNIYNAGTFDMTSGAVTNGFTKLISDGETGGNLYAASGSTANIDGEYAKFGSGAPNDFYAHSGSRINIKNGRFSGKLGGVVDSYNITGGWFITADNLYTEKNRKGECYVGDGYSISPKIVNAPDSTTPIKVYPNSEKATVTFYNNCEQGGTSVIETPKGYEIAIPTCAVERVNWEALSWNTDEYGKGTKYYPNSEGESYHPGEAAYHLIPNANMSLYADWTTTEHAQRKLTFRDETGANSDVTVTYTDRKVRCDFPNKFHRSLYTLIGVTLDPNGDTIIYDGDTIDWGYKHLEATVYLVWQSDIDAMNTNSDTKTITYCDDQEGNGKFVFKTSKSSTQIIDAGFESKTYSFDCWCDKADGSGTMYGIGDTYTFSDNSKSVKLYAVWKNKADISNTSTRYGEYTETGSSGKTVDMEEENKTQEEKHDDSYKKPGYCSLTYDDGYGDNNQFKQTFGETSARVIGSIWSRTNYKFTGWTTTAGSDKVEYVAGDSINVADSPTLYAVWKQTGNSQPDPRQEIIEQNDDPTYNPVEEYKELDDQINNTGENTGSGTGSDTGSGTGSGTDSNIPEGEYYSDAAEWAYEEGIATGGTDGSFNAEAACSRADMITFLWRSMGEPEPRTTVNPFDDIKATDYFYKAVLWGYEEGIVKGTGGNHFSPTRTTTRAQGLTFLYRTVGEPSVDLSLISKFKDVKSGEYYTDAVAWAIEEGVTTGTSATTFSPERTCTRGEIITFMYRALGTSTY